MTFRHRAGVTLYTSSCELAQCCVFDKQSPGPILCALPATKGLGHDRVISTTVQSHLVAGEGPLIANVRGEFAEFLHNRSLERLRLFAKPTCVSLRYGFHDCHRTGFRGIDPPNTGLKGLDASQSRPSFTIRHAGSTAHERAGILTCCPSTTPFGLALGPA